MSNIGIPSPTADVASLLRTVRALQEQVEILTGDRGDQLDRAARLTDLVGFELLTASNTGTWDYVLNRNNVVLSPSAADSLIPSLNFVGSFATAPTAIDLGVLWVQNAVYKNTTDGKSYVLTGTPLAWVEYLVDGQLFLLTIESSNGTTFRVGESSQTILLGRLFKNGAEVTDVTPGSWFRWRRSSAIPQAPPADDTTWNNLYVSGYKQVTINVDEVFARATFFCDVISP